MPLATQLPRPQAGGTSAPNARGRALLMLVTALFAALFAYALIGAGRIQALQSADSARAPTEKPPAERPRLLIYSKTAGFRHDSIPTGIACVRELLSDRFEIDATEDALLFTPANLARYRVVVFLSTTGDVLDEEQQRAFEGFIRAGGGFAGIHAAADTEHAWPWYGRLVGAYFKTHPEIQEALVRVEDKTHPSTVMLPTEWRRTDEWYVYSTNPRSRVRVLASLDDSTITGVSMGGDHPIAWFHFFEGGRSWYTGGGHTHESFAEPLFRAHIEGGILWAAGVADVIRAPERTTPEVSPAAPATAPAAAPATKPNVE